MNVEKFCARKRNNFSSSGNPGEMASRIDCNFILFFKCTITYLIQFYIIYLNIFPFKYIFVLYKITKFTVYWLF